MNTEEVDTDPICCGDYMTFRLVDRWGAAHFYCPVCHNVGHVYDIE